MKAVDKLIYNLILSHRDFYLPEVGAIRYERQGAKLIDNRHLKAPVHQAVFSTDTEGLPSLVDIIVEQAGCSRTDAEKIYSMWLVVAAEQEGKVIINGVGEISDNFLHPTSKLLEALNPHLQEMILKPRGGVSRGVAIVVIGLIVGVGAGYFIYEKYLPTPSEKVVPITVKEPVKTPVEVKDTTTTIASVGDTISCKVDEVIEGQIADIMEDPQSKPYQIIIGVFSTMENAEKAMTELKMREGDIGCYILESGNRFHLSLAGAESLSEAESLQEEFSSIDPDVWIRRP